MVNKHDFTKTGWGHNLISRGNGRFTSLSTPIVRPGDTITYITGDYRTVTYPVLEEEYKRPGDPEDMAHFTVGWRIENE